jgi:hypothetical protein
MFIFLRMNWPRLPSRLCLTVHRSILPESACFLTLNADTHSKIGPSFLASSSRLMRLPRWRAERLPRQAAR